MRLLVENGILPTDPDNLPSPVNCECVPIRDCGDSATDGNSGVLNFGIGNVVDLRIQGRACADPLFVCCQNPNVLKSNIPVEKPQHCGKRNDLGVDVTIAFFNVSLYDLDI